MVSAISVGSRSSWYLKIIAMRGVSGSVAISRRNIPPSIGSPAAGRTEGSATSSSATCGRRLPLARGIDGALHRHLAQPEAGVGGRFNAGQILVQAEEDVLRDLLRQVAVVQKVPEHAEHHGAVFAHQFTEVQGLPYRGQSDHFSFAR